MPPFINRKRRESSSDAQAPPPKRKKPADEAPKATLPKEKSGKDSKRKKKAKPQIRRVANKESKKPSLFDSVDRLQGVGPSDSNLFAGTGDSDDDDLSSDPDSDEFEDVVVGKRGGKKTDTEDEQDAEDEEPDDWEDAVNALGNQPITSDTPAQALELNLGGQRTADVSYADLTGGKKQGPSKRQKQIRILAHSIHVQYLMWHNHVRNHWLNDSEVQKIMVGHMKQSQKLKVQFENWKTKSGIRIDTPQSAAKNVPAGAKNSGKGKGRRQERQDPRKERDWGRPAERQSIGEPDFSRGDPLQHLLSALATWWKQRFTITAPGLRKHGYKAMRDLKGEMEAWRKGESDIKEHGERIDNLKEFRAHAKRCEGSRDVGAQLFVALLRGLGIDARMAGSLQPLGYGWTKLEEAEVKPKKAATKPASEPTTVSKKAASSKSKPKQKSTGSKNDAIALSDTSDLSELQDARQEDDSESDASIIDITPKKRPNMPYDRDLPFPNYWIEAISSLTQRVFPVDPFILQTSVATNAEGLMQFEVRGAKADKARQVFAYVVAHSSDNTAKDVTVRYLKQHIFPGKTKGSRLPNAKFPVYDKRGRVRGYYEVDWWQSVLRPYRRPDTKRTIADDAEDQGDLVPREPEKKAPKQGVPDTLDGFKRSAEYVLERHLRREEALLPGAVSVQTFKSGKRSKETEDAVYLRKDVATCRTAESWHKEGRKVKVGQQPLKRVPYRAVTTSRKREIEEEERETGEKAMQGMYAKDQTEWIIPDPIQNGVIPKNGYGNMDAFVPQMVPKGAVHLRMRGTVKVCKKLGIDFAEAVTGFEFGNRMAVPVIEGVVVAEENRDLVVDAWNKAEDERRIKEAAKQEKLILGTWRKFLMGLRVIERMREEYEVGVDDHEQERINPFTNTNRKSGAKSEEQPKEDKPVTNGHDVEMAGGFDHEEAEMGGGFLPEGQEVELVANGARDRAIGDTEAGGFLIEGDDDAIGGSTPVSKPKMRSLAEIAAQRAPEDDTGQISDDAESVVVDEPALKTKTKTKAKAKAKSKTTPKPTPARRGRPPKLENASPTGSKSQSEAESDDLSELSDVEPPKPTKTLSSRATRASARSAAKVSRGKTRSHFFKSDTLTDEDEDEGGA